MMENFACKPPKNGWLRNFFATKKNKRPKNRACHCCTKAQETKKDQIIQTNISADVKEDEKLPILNVNAYGDPKKMQKNGECPGKMFPLERRGCGFHLYFCIDNAGKPNLVRNNKNKIVRNQRNAVGNCLEVDKASTSCVSESGSLTDIVKSHSGSQRSPSNKRGKEISDHETQSQQVVFRPVSAGKKPKENEIGKDIDSSPGNQDENPSGNSILRNTKPSEHIMIINSVLKDRRDSFPVNRSLKYPQLAEPVNHSSITRKSYPLTPLSLPESQIYRSETALKAEKEPLRRKNNSLIEEETFFKEYTSTLGDKPRRKSTLRGRGTLVRNSLISLRKKRQSFLSDMIPEIITKLDNIDEKLTELEKVYEVGGRGKSNITNIVGISCKSVKSAPSMDLKNLEPKGSDKKKYNISYALQTPLRIQPVLVESQVPSVPQNVSVGGMRSKQWSKQLVHHNTHELDAHNIASKSLSKTTGVKSQITKPDLGKKTLSKETTNKKCSDMWSKISEELKM